MQSKSIADISIRVSSGITPLRSKPEFWREGSIPWLKTEQIGEKYIYDTHEKISVSALKKTTIKLYPPNTLSIAMYGEGKTRGNLSIIKSEMATNQACCNVEIDPEKANYEYVYYFLKTQYKELRRLSSGVRKNLNTSDIKNFSVRLPSTIEQQDKIAALLSGLDKKIELNNQINSELEAMTKLIYDYWFLQFDFPDNHGKPYKSSGGMMQYNEILKREIPERWNVTNLKKNSLSEIIIPKVYEFDGKKIYLSTSDVQENNINFKAKNVTFSHRPSRANMQPVNNSVWFAKMKNTKKVLYVGDYSKEFIDNLILSTGFAGLKCRKNSLEYVWGSINNNRFEFIKDKLCSSTTQEAINNNTMVLIPFLEPTKEVLDKYHASVKNIYMKIYNNQVENMYLSNLIEWLLPMLMNGQVKIK